ncbi:hypothetical protein CAPTEDRAFT_216847, partial [Capitella teleta]
MRKDAPRHMPVDEISFEKPKLGGKNSGVFQSSAAKRRLFQPAKKQPVPKDIIAFMTKLAVSAPKAVFRKVWPERTGAIASSTPRAVLPEKPLLPPSVQELASSSTSVDELLSKLPLWDPEIIGFVERETVGQGATTAWKDQRRGKITASSFHPVLTSMRRDPTGDKDNLLASVLGYTQSPEDLFSLKYGRAMEPVAKKAFLQVMRAAGHVNPRLHECGLFTLAEHPFIGASLDGIFECNCCGQSILEVKCPSTLACIACAPQA